MSIYLEVRPNDLDGIVGQDLEVAKLKKMVKEGTLPRVILFKGPTGTGKTTTARILARMLGVKPELSNPNYSERNCADCRGIDDVREIDNDMRLSPLGGKYRVWVLDEIVQLPKVTQQAMLKMLEDTPPHVYFFLCTSETKDLLPTLIGRCQPVVFKAIPVDTLMALVTQTAKNLKHSLSPKVAKQIATLADGSARMALQLLESALAHSKESQQLEAVSEAEQETIAIDLARAIFYRKGWSEVVSIINRLTDKPETVRRVVLRYCETVMLGNGKIQDMARADVVISYFRDAWTDCDRSGLLTSCWRVTNSK